MSRLRSFFGGREKKPTRNSEESAEAMSISGPTNVTHDHHVGFDHSTGTLVGLPPSWKEWLKTANIRQLFTIAFTLFEVVGKFFGFLTLQKDHLNSHIFCF